MPFPRGEEPSLDDLRATSEPVGGGEDAGWGDEGDSSGEGVGPVGGEPSGAGAPAGPGEDDNDPRARHNLTQAVNQYREELRAMKAERLAERAEVAELRQWRAEMQRAINEERMRAEQAAREAQAQADPEPDQLLEPDKHEEWVRRQEQKKFDEVRGELHQTREQLHVQRQQQIAMKLESDLDGFQNRFMQQRPDYLQAYEHLVGSLVAHYKKLGWQDQQIYGEEGLLARDRDSFLRSCLEIHPSGAFRWVRDPAEGLYAAAQQYGWGQGATAAAPAATQPAGAARKPAAANRRPARPPALANAAAAAAGAGGGAGGADTPLTAESILNLSPREYAWLNHNRPDIIEKILRDVS